MKILHQGQFKQFVNNEGYEHLHEEESVIIFCKRIFKDGTTRFSVRSEYVPPYSTTENYYTTVSGGVEENETNFEAAIRELEEETGIKLLNSEILLQKSYEHLPVCKSTDIRVSLFYCEIKEENEGIDYEIVPITGDGTEFENKSQTLWLTFDEMIEILEKQTNYDLLFLFSILIHKEMV